MTRSLLNLKERADPSPGREPHPPANSPPPVLTRPWLDPPGPARVRAGWGGSGRVEPGPDRGRPRGDGLAKGPDLLLFLYSRFRRTALTCPAGTTTETTATTTILAGKVPKRCSRHPPLTLMRKCHQLREACNSGCLREQLAAEWSGSGIPPALSPGAGFKSGTVALVEVIVDVVVVVVVVLVMLVLVLVLVHGSGSGSGSDSCSRSGSASASATGTGSGSSSDSDSGSGKRAPVIASSSDGSWARSIALYW